MPIIVLGIYVVVCGAIVTIYSWGPWGKQKKETGTTGPPAVIDPDEEIGAAAIPPG